MRKALAAFCWSLALVAPLAAHARDGSIANGSTLAKMSVGTTTSTPVSSQLAYITITPKRRPPASDVPAEATPVPSHLAYHVITPGRRRPA
jgi:hypothetical protein